ncbi:FAD-dependent monooxygenase [Micromonospora sp. DT4]|uniref:FAD-dependent oxidoreductase n=1 Tax=Micromonospora sp. DT4 TaxID=3393438 RepID=UPI003CFAA44D
MGISTDFSVAIAGGGLSGLCLAQYLMRAGIDVHVYERDPGPFVRRQGYRIILDRYGLEARLRGPVGAVETGRRDDHGLPPAHPAAGRHSRAGRHGAQPLRRGPTPAPMGGAPGDALHVMPPFGAHGGNTALRDAALLGRKLVEARASGRGVEEAIAAYQEEMVPYAFRAVDTAGRLMRRLTGGAAAPHWVLTRVLPRLHRVTVPEA